MQDNSHYKEAWEMLEWAVKKHITACTINIIDYKQNPIVSLNHIKTAVHEKLMWEGMLKLMNLYLERSEDNDRSGKES